MQSFGYRIMLQPTELHWAREKCLFFIFIFPMSLCPYTLTHFLFLFLLVLTFPSFLLPSLPLPSPSLSFLCLPVLFFLLSFFSLPLSHPFIITVVYSMCDTYHNPSFLFYKSTGERRSGSIYCISATLLHAELI